MKSIRKALVVVGLVAAACSCNTNKNQKIQFSGKAQGTYYAVTYYDSRGRDFRSSIDSLLTEFDNTASLWVDTSVIRRVNANENMCVNPLFADLFAKSQGISKATDGYFDITVGKLVNAWGFGFSEAANVDAAVIDSLKQYVGYDKLAIHNDTLLVKENPCTELDFNAIAQGYSVDMVGDFLKSKGVQNFLVDIGGEVLAYGSKPDGGRWMVGIEKPAQNKYSTQEVDVKIALTDKSVVTSGNYRKYYEADGVKYSHTIDPFTGYPVKHTLLSVSVVALEAWEADAMATAFMVMGLEKALEFLENTDKYEAYFIYTENGDYKTYSTKGFDDMIVK